MSDTKQLVEAVCKADGITRAAAASRIRRMSDEDRQRYVKAVKKLAPKESKKQEDKET